MGKKHSKSSIITPEKEYGTIYIDLNKTTFNPGEKIQGNVYLELTQKYPANQVILKFSGKENIFFTLYPNSKPSNNQIPRYIHSIEYKKKTIELTIPLYSWENSTLIPQGQYILPYELTIPSRIPSTFFQKGWCLLGSISYKLQVYLGNSGSNAKKPKKELKPTKLNIKQPITIIEEENQTRINTEVSKKTQITFSCCCIFRGSSIISYTIDKNNYSPGENLELIVHVDNTKSHYDCISITYCLKHKLSLNAPKAGTKREYNLAAGKFIKIATKKTVSYPRIINIKLPSMEYGNIMDYKDKNFKQILLNEREEHRYSNPSVEAQLIKSTYQLEITFEYKGMFQRSIMHYEIIPIIMNAIALGKTPEQIKPSLNYLPQILNTNNKPNHIMNHYDNNTQTNKNILNNTFIFTEIKPEIDLNITRDSKYENINIVNNNTIMDIKINDINKYHLDIITDASHKDRSSMQNDSQMINLTPKQNEDSKLQADDGKITNEGPEQSESIQQSQNLQIHREEEIKLNILNNSRYSSYDDDNNKPIEQEPINNENTENTNNSRKILRIKYNTYA